MGREWVVGKWNIDCVQFINPDFAREAWTWDKKKLDEEWAKVEKQYKIERNKFYGWDKPDNIDFLKKPKFTPSDNFLRANDIDRVKFYFYRAYNGGDPEKNGPAWPTSVRGQQSLMKAYGYKFNQIPKDKCAKFSHPFFNASCNELPDWRDELDIKYELAFQKEGLQNAKRNQLEEQLMDDLLKGAKELEGLKGKEKEKRAKELEAELGKKEKAMKAKE